MNRVLELKKVLIWGDELIARDGDEISVSFWKENEIRERLLEEVGGVVELKEGCMMVKTANSKTTNSRGGYTTEISYSDILGVRNHITLKSFGRYERKDKIEQ